MTRTSNTSSSGASSNQAVNVAAVNQATNFSFAGGLGGGIAGIAGGVDVGLLNNSTQAYIGNGSDVHAHQDVDVYALSNDSVQTYALGAAAGIVGLVGSVSVWSIGEPYSARLYRRQRRATARFRACRTMGSPARAPTRKARPAGPRR